MAPKCLKAEGNQNREIKGTLSGGEGGAWLSGLALLAGRFGRRCLAGVHDGRARADAGKRGRRGMPGVSLCMIPEATEWDPVPILNAIILVCKIGLGLGCFR